MMLETDIKKKIRECDLEWQCHEISIYQKELKDGHEFKGYGTIKNSETGELYLDFICLESNKALDFRNQIPEDSLDPKQSITMKATSLCGIDVISKGLTITGVDFHNFSVSPSYLVYFCLGLKSKIIQIYQKMVLSYCS